MSDIKHHIPEPILTAYAGGQLPQAFSLVVAAHVSLCAACRASLEAHHLLGGQAMADTAPVTPSPDLRDRVLSALDEPVADEPDYHAEGIYPAPVMAALKGNPPKWSRIGRGIRQMSLGRDEAGAARLLYIPPGQAVPDHGHNGLELTMVLQGSFSDGEGRFDAGDVEIADEATEHQPVAGEGVACICLAATDAPLEFRDWAPRLLQPLMGI